MPRPAEEVLRELAGYFEVHGGEPIATYASLRAVFKPSRGHNWCFAWARNSYDEAALAHLAKLINEARVVAGMVPIVVRPRAEPVIALDDRVGIGLTA